MNCRIGDFIKTIRPNNFSEIFQIHRIFPNGIQLVSTTNSNINFLIQTPEGWRYQHDATLLQIVCIKRAPSSFIPSNQNKNIVIIGAGPVGLLAAIHISRIFSYKDIWVLEKRAFYERDQFLVLSPQTLKSLPKEVLSELFGKGKPGCHILHPSRDRHSRCYRVEGELTSVRISLLEDALFRYASRISNVKIIRPVPVISFSPDEGELHFNNTTLKYSMLIGADGANSQVRDQVLQARFDPNPLIGEEDETEEEKEMYGGIFIFKDLSNEIYDVPTPEHLKEFENSEIQYDYRSFRSQLDNIHYIGLSLNLQEHEEIQNKTISEQLQRKISQALHGPYREPTTYYSFSILPRISSAFSELRPYPTFLIGDSAMTTHFFTGAGYNMGVIMVLVLTDLLKKYPNGRIPDDLYFKQLIQLVMHIGESVNQIS